MTLHSHASRGTQLNHVSQNHIEASPMQKEITCKPSKPCVSHLVSLMAL